MKNSIDYKGTSTLESMTQAKFYNRWTLAKFDKFLKGSILEVGYGIGTFTQTLAKYGKVTAIDIDQNLIEKIKIDRNFNTRIGYGDIERAEYFFKNGKFDTIVCINVLEHIEDDSKAFANMYNLLQENGVLILLIPAHLFLFGEIDKSIGHFRRYSKKDIIAKLETSGFKIIKFRSLNLFGSIGWFISGRVFKNKIVDQSKIRLFNVVAPFFLRIEDLINPPFGTSFLIIAKKK